MRKGAAELLLQALSDSRPSVRQAALHGLGYSVCQVAVATVQARLNDTDPKVRRQAATTLGIMRDRSSVTPLLFALNADKMQRELEHTLIFALIEIGDAEAIRTALAGLIKQHPDQSGSLRGALVAIDQMDNAEVRISEVRAALVTHDPDTVRVAVRILEKHPEWASEVSQMVGQWVSVC